MRAELIPLPMPRELSELGVICPPCFLPNEKAAERFFNYFTSHIHNDDDSSRLLQHRVPVFGMCEGRGLRDPASPILIGRRGTFRNLLLLKQCGLLIKNVHLGIAAG